MSRIDMNRRRALVYKILESVERFKKECQEDKEQPPKEYRDVCKQISECMEMMARCFEKSRGLDPSSIAYRNHERTFYAERDKLYLLVEQQESLCKKLENAGLIVDGDAICPQHEEQKIKQRDEKKPLRSQYDKVWKQFVDGSKQIAECMETMVRCRKEIANLDPSSIAYRNHARTFYAERDKLYLLVEQQESLYRKLERAGLIRFTDEDMASFQDVNMRKKPKDENNAESEESNRRLQAFIDSLRNQYSDAAQEAEKDPQGENGTAAEPETQEGECDAHVAAASEE